MWFDRVQRWFFPYDYQIVQEIHRHEPDNAGSALLEVGTKLTPEEARSFAFAQLPGQSSRHTGFAFDSPNYESFFASQHGVSAPHKAWDVIRRASMKHRKAPKHRWVHLTYLYKLFLRFFYEKYLHMIICIIDQHL